MNLLKLKVTVIGTNKSRVLDKDEEHEFEIPTWIPNPAQGLYNANDYQDFIMEAAPQQSGDRVLSIKAMLATVPDDTDEQVALYDEAIEWNFKGDLVTENIRGIYESNPIHGNASEVARFIYENYGNWFGWWNGDPADVLDEIQSHLYGIMPLYQSDENDVDFE